ncbi:hypothetical protein [Amycolatopsis sp. TNS106]|uniref:hypothetical protein n=1 Tax=Amycolatopsis sp. TNS106 TaxID=2861750 RepID=UPI001C567F64|nr:hypothetical protein [Amycolatopsis sp. TNS106]QXV55757.1 hypothetical protein CVV72_01115 [Amycolatopsis sp. TNS106]
MNRLEDRYRRVLRLLPASYRQAWEEDMVATFLQSEQPEDTEDAEFAADYGRPSLPEVASVVALAVRLRLGGDGSPPRYLAWGETVRRLALVGLLVQAVAALAGLGAGLWSPWVTNVVAVDRAADVQALFGLVWVAAYLSLVTGRWRSARLLAVLALAPSVVFFAVDFATVEGAYGLSRVTGLLVDAVPVLALAAFHRQASPVKARPWLIALPVGVSLLTIALLLTSFTAPALVDWPGVVCTAVFVAAVMYLSVPGMSWRSATVSWSTTLALFALTALGQRVVTLLDYLQFAARTADLDVMITIAAVQAAAVLVIATPLTMLAAKAMRTLPAVAAPVKSSTPPGETD